MIAVEYFFNHHGDAMTMRILILAAIALLGGVLPANAFLEFVYSDDGKTVLTVAPASAFGPMTLDFAYLLSTNVYATNPSLSVSSGEAAFSGSNSFNEYTTLP